MSINNEVEVSVHPPFTDLRSVQTVIDADRMLFRLGAQNCHAETSGAFTGEVSPAMLQKMDVDFVIVGHSERRALFGETNEIVAAKALAVATHEMTPIVCVGGNPARKRKRGSRISGRSTGVRQLGFFKGEKLTKTVVAYEPVWAIGTGVTASASDAQQMCAHIRSVIKTIKKSAAKRCESNTGDQ